MTYMLRHAAFLTVLLLLAACAPSTTRGSNNNAAYAAPAVGSRYSDSQGVASWYGPGFAGKRTASGETFNPSDLTAAHPSLPFGTLVRVTNIRNGASVIVRINDRGPYKAGRTIDLSQGAAAQIGLLQAGVAQVQLEVLSSFSHASTP